DCTKLPEPISCGLRTRARPGLYSLYVSAYEDPFARCVISTAKRFCAAKKNVSKNSSYSSSYAARCPNVNYISEQSGTSVLWIVDKITKKYKKISLGRDGESNPVQPCIHRGALTW
ncbi:unnamed protein product, partial [Pylaiella littoralis]